MKKKKSQKKEKENNRLKFHRNLVQDTGGEPAEKSFSSRLLLGTAGYPSLSILANALKDVDYDFVLIDTLPSFSLLFVNAIAASDFVLVPVKLEYLSMQGLNLARPNMAHNLYHLR